MPEETFDDSPFAQEQKWQRDFNRSQRVGRKTAATKSAAAGKGTAISGALKGEGTGEILQSGANLYLLNFCFGFLWTIFGFIPALLYLDFHYIMSKGGSKWFSEMFIWQKIVLAFANFLFLVIIIILMPMIAIIWCGLNKIDCTWEVLKIIANQIF